MDLFEPPRQIGLTMMMDKGVGIQQFADHLHLASMYLDFVKLGFGTLRLTPPEIVKQKLTIAEQSGVALYPGGTLFEWFVARGKWEWYLEEIFELGFSWVEISDGTITLTPTVRSQAIQRARSIGFQVITEIGKKAAGAKVSFQELVAGYELDVADGATYVIVEGRESGQNVGMYDQTGALDANYVQQVCRRIDQRQLIWEAPRTDQQVALIQLLGNHVNLGNVCITDTLSLAALRRGLRADTFDQLRE